MDLLPFTAAHAATVTDWQRDADARARVLVEDGTVVGYGELWLDDEEDEVELARLIVAPDTRGKGVGPHVADRLGLPRRTPTRPAAARPVPGRAAARSADLRGGAGSLRPRRDTNVVTARRPGPPPPGRPP